MATETGCVLDPTQEPIHPVELFGCAAALPSLGKFVAENADDPNSPYTMNEELHGDRAFVIRSCATRGRYTWKAGRFVRCSR